MISSLRSKILPGVKENGCFFGRRRSLLLFYFVSYIYNIRSILLEVILDVIDQVIDQITERTQNAEHPGLEKRLV